MATRHLLVFCAAWAAAAQVSELPAGAEWEEDDACPAGASPESCALSLRQLRARGAVAAPVAPHAKAPEAPAKVDAPQLAEAPEAPAKVDTPQLAETAEEHAQPEEDDFDGVPGGWGEAANFASELEPDMNKTAEHGWGSCASYGCINYYHRGHGCQCNSGCSRHRNCCSDYGSRCSHHHHHHNPAPAPSGNHGHKILTLYHQTSQSACNLILRSNFRPGRQGWCGGGIYFATSPQATNTKAIGPDSHKGCILKATVDVGRVMFLSSHCDRGLSGGRVWSKGYDSVSFNPGDGQEYIVYSNNRVLHISKYR